MEIQKCSPHVSFLFLFSQTGILYEKSNKCTKSLIMDKILHPNTFTGKKKSSGDLRSEWQPCLAVFILLQCVHEVSH